MKVVAINASPRTGWNTAQLVNEAAKGAAEAGAEVTHFDLYQLEKYTGCLSCFGCKRGEEPGWCVVHDGLYPVLRAIREADAVIIGTPVYLGQASAGFHALYERQLYQNTTYQNEKPRYHDVTYKTLLIVTSNAPDASYEPGGRNAQLVETLKAGLIRGFGPTEVFTSGDTLQVDDYSKYNWTRFNPEAKIRRHETVFPEHLKKAYEMGKELCTCHS